LQRFSAVYFGAARRIDSLLVGLLTSMPAFTGLLLAIPVGRMLERQTNIVPWYSRARIWVQATYAVTGILPFFMPLEYIPVAIIFIGQLPPSPNHRQYYFYRSHGSRC
jgi:hypothetical protein